MKPVTKFDWKHFNASLGLWRERYLERVNHEIGGLLTTPGQTPTERFWATHDRVRAEKRILHECFDGFSKARMPEYLALMHRYGIITDEDFAGFSDAPQADLRYWTAAPEASGAGPQSAGRTP